MSSSSTGRLLIEGAIRLIRGNDKKPDRRQIDTGLIALNDLLASLSADKILVPAVVDDNFILTIGTSSYTIGSGGTVDTVRPSRILSGAYIRDSNSRDHPVTVITREKYTRLTSKSVNNRPTWLYYDPQYPLGTIYFDSRPDTAEIAYISSLKPISDITTTNLDVALVVPPEYKRMLRYNLAIDLAPEYNNIKIPEFVTNTAKESKEAIQRLNSQPVEEVRFDSLLLSTGHLTLGTFNAG